MPSFQPQEEVEVPSDPEGRDRANDSAGTYKDRKPLRETVPLLGEMPSLEAWKEKIQGILKRQKEVRADVKRAKKQKGPVVSNEAPDALHTEHMNEVETSNNEIQDELLRLDNEEEKSLREAARMEGRGRGRGRSRGRGRGVKVKRETPEESPKVEALEHYKSQLCWAVVKRV